MVQVPMSSALFQSYTIPRGAPVRVCDDKGYLHKHKLKHTQQFTDSDRMYATFKDMTFVEVGRGALNLAHLEATGFIVFATGRERWPYIVCGGHATLGYE